MESRPGQFICIEGIDGAGKTTVTKELGELFGEDSGIVTLGKQEIEYGSAYLRRHMANLRKLIWDHPVGDPHYVLGPMHAVFLQLSWFSAVDMCRIGPLIEAGKHVVIDNWTYKFLGRIYLNHPEVYDLATRSMGELRQPDLVVRLRLSVEVALGRKQEITAAEAGVIAEGQEPSPERFVLFQKRLDRVLDRFGAENNWSSADASGSSGQTATAAAAVIRRHLRSVELDAAAHTVVRSRVQ